LDLSETGKGAIGNLYMSSGSSAAQLVFPRPVKLVIIKNKTVLIKLSFDFRVYGTA